MATKVKWYGRRYTRGLYNYVDRKENDYADRLKNNTKSICPVDSGALKASIKVEKQKEMEYRVQSDKDYAKYVEYGTATMAPQPYFRPALNRTKGL